MSCAQVVAPRPINLGVKPTTIESDPDVEALLRDARRRAARPLSRRERIAEAATAAALVAVVLVLASAGADPAAAIGASSVLLVVAYAVAQRVRFSVGAGMTSPALLVLVPMLLLTPPAFVPLLVALALVVSRLPEYLGRRVHPDHVLLHLGDAWFAVGPAAVLTLAAPGAPSFRHWPVYAAALGAQLVADAGASVLRERLASGVAAALQLKVLMLVFAIDLALAPLGLLVAGAAPAQPFAVLLALPLLGMLAVMARERERRIDQALALSASYRRAGNDSVPDAAWAALGAIQAIGGSSAEARARVAEEFVSSAPRPDDYLLRRWAEESWPELAARWGRAAPIATGRSAQDYRDLVRRFIVAPDSVARPKVIIETDQRGPMEVELLGPEAPMTVANFLRLVDRRFFDRNRWHRVVPNFVVQDGDPRGDGFGGPGGAIRDEVNRHRYDGPMLGMALSGPDTGSSQWFITLSPQPHLDGTYTIFGRVTGGLASLARITQGDVIRSIRMK